MKWPWQKRKETTLERVEAEARADTVHEEVIRPLREMRARNHFADAIARDMQRRLKEN